MSEIDWNKVYCARIAECCRRAGADCNVAVTTPFLLTGGYSFIAHFPGIGPKNGILVCLASEWESLNEVAHQHGYTCVGILPDTCSRYDPQRWETIVKEWRALSDRS
jgi:hypothetical protein